MGAQPVMIFDLGTRHWWSLMVILVGIDRTPLHPDELWILSVTEIIAMVVVVMDGFCRV